MLNIVLLRFWSLKFGFSDLQYSLLKLIWTICKNMVIPVTTIHVCYAICCCCNLPVQKRATKLIPELSKKSYSDRLKSLNLPTLKYRRYRGNMIELFKIVNGKYDSACIPHFEFMELSDNLIRTRGNKFKLVQHHCHYDLRKYNFTNRVIPIWNSLSNFVVSAETINTFKPFR